MMIHLIERGFYIVFDNLKTRRKIFGTKFSGKKNHQNMVKNLQFNCSIQGYTITLRNQGLRWKPGNRKMALGLGEGFICNHSSLVN